MQLNLWRAGNPARSRLSGGSICTRPGKLLWLGREPRLHWILFYISPDTVELRIGSDQTVEAFLLPKWFTSSQEKIGLVSGETFERAQPFCGKHVRSSQKMHVIRHHNERMELIPVECAISVPQCRDHHFCNFRPPQKQGAIRACVQEPVDGYERLARRDEPGWWEHSIRRKTAMQSERHKQRLLDYVPMGQSPFIAPHSCLLCGDGGETLTALQPPFRRPSRLKAGCGQDCPPSNWQL